jgi:hypothetical protein
MATEPGVLAVFADPSLAARATRALKAEGLDVRAAMPAPFPELVAALGRPRSPLGAFTLAGAILGGCCGLLLSAGTARLLPMTVGGMPPVALPAFLVIVFELAVLFGALVNFTALQVAAFRGRRSRPVPWDDRFSRDRIGLFVAGGHAGRAAELFKSNGAEEVRDVA